MTTSTTAGSERLVTPQFAILMLTGSVYFFGVGGLNSLIPPYVVDELGGSETTSGVVMGSFAISALVTRAAFGRTADRHGARRIIVMGALIAAASMVILLTTTSVFGAIAARLVLGAGGAAFMTGATLLSIELAPEERRSQAAAFILISFHAGMGTGPLVAERVLDATSYATIWWLIAGLTLAAAAIGMVLHHRPGIADPNEDPAPLIHPAALGPGVVTLLGVVAFNGFLMFVPLYAREVGLDDVGIVFAIASITIVIARLFFGRVPDIIGPIPAGTYALGLTAFAAVVISLWASPTGLYVGAALVAAGLSLQSPSFMKMAVEGVSPRERGSVMATFTAFYDVAGAAVGPMLGVMIAAFGYRSAFLLTGACSAVAIVVLWLLVAPAWNQRVAVA